MSLEHRVELPVIFCLQIPTFSLRVRWMSGAACKLATELAQAVQCVYVCRSKVTKFANGFEVHSLYQTTDPNAAVAAPGRQVFMKYRGTLENGKVRLPGWLPCTRGFPQS